MKSSATRYPFPYRFWQFACLGGMAVMLAACSENDMLAGDVSGYNHMPESGWSIAGFTVNGAGGANASPGYGAGSSCCMSFPKHWRPGMKAKVRWFYDVMVGDPRTPPPAQEAEVEIPEYTPKTAGAINVHFYSDHRIKVVISRYAIEHPRYPLSEEAKKPWITRTDIVGE